MPWASSSPSNKSYLFCFQESTAQVHWSANGLSGGFSRGGIGSRGGLSARTPQRSPQRMDNRTGGLGDNRGDRLDNRGDNMNDRQDWGDNNREDRQDDRQDFIEVEIDDDWDRCRGDCGGVVAGVVVGAAIGAAATHDLHTVIYTLPCSTTAVMFNSVSYYNCSGVWYERVYSGGDVTYIVTTPPPGH